MNMGTGIDIFNVDIDKRIIVKNPSDFGVIDSTVIYIIDGKIDMGTTQIEVPSGGIFIKGLDYFVSSLFSSSNNTTLFVNKSGENAGNVRISGVELYTTGSNSKIFDLDNQGNFSAIELQSVNIGRFASQQDEVGSLSNYRQFRTNDCALIRVLEGITFNGVWQGGFRIGDSILLSIPSNANLFKEGISLVFQGSSFTDLNAISIDDTAKVFDFQESNFLLDEGFKIDGARFNINSNPIPNLSEKSTKAYFRGRGILNTFPGGGWEMTNDVVTSLAANDPPIKMNGVTTYSNLVHFESNGDNSIRYMSTITKSFKISGQLIVEGGANDEIEISIVKNNIVNLTTETIKTFIRRINNSVGGFDVAYFNVESITDIEKDDDIEIHGRNLTDGTNATIENGSFINISVRN